MIYLFCGTIIGIVLGLTGAGGALIAIPLFMQFLEMTLKEASVYSLLAVLVASLFNYIDQRKATQYRTGFIIIIASAFSSYITAPFKESLPTLYIGILLSVVSLYALYGVWKPVKSNTEGKDSHNPISLSIIVGFILGALTTFTGLGGGVLMLPLFLSFFRYSVAQAVATSLFAVGLSSLTSFLIQIFQGTNLELKFDFIYLLFGISLSVFMLKKLTQVFQPPTLAIVRKLVFTFVVILALLKIFQ